jgi:hypothetical protein
MYKLPFFLSLPRGRPTTVSRTAGILPACRRDGGVTKRPGSGDPGEAGKTRRRYPLFQKAPMLYGIMKQG